MNSPSEKNTSDSLLQALLEKNTQDLAEIQLKPYTPTVYAIPDTIWTAMINLLQNAVTFQPTLYQKLQPLATWEEVQELAAQMGETQEQTVQKALSLVVQTNRQALSQIQEELEKEQASRETFQQQVGKEQERFTSKLSRRVLRLEERAGGLSAADGAPVAAASPEVYPGAAALLGLGLRGIVDAAAVIENEEEDEEQRRERILAEENGQDLGAALGIALGLASTLLEDEDPLPRRRALLLLCKHTGGSVDQTRNYKIPEGVSGSPHREGAVGDPAGEHQNRV